MNTKLEFHGSDIEKVCEHYGLKKDDIVNFGANVNPLGLSEQVKKALAAHLDLLSSYPDRSYTSLRNILSTYCPIPADFILPGNGSSELISLLIEERRPKHTMILGPTYSEYSRELGLFGLHKIRKSICFLASARHSSSTDNWKSCSGFR